MVMCHQTWPHRKVYKAKERKKTLAGFHVGFLMREAVSHSRSFSKSIVRTDLLEQDSITLD